MRRLWVAAVVLFLAGCSAPDPEPNLFGEYLKSTTVRNDRFPTPAGNSSEDRMANFAAIGTPEQLAYQLLAPYQCGQSTGDEDRCDPSVAAQAEVRRLGGDPVKLTARSLLVKPKGGELELVTVYLVAGHVIDNTGASATSLEEFRRKNKVLEPDDVMLTVDKITATSAEGATPTTVYGHTRSPWPQYTLATAATLILLTLALLLAKRLHKPRT